MCDRGGGRVGKRELAELKRRRTPVDRFIDGDLTALQLVREMAAKTRRPVVDDPDDIAVMASLRRAQRKLSWINRPR